MTNLFKTVLSAIYINNLYLQRCPLLIASKDDILEQKAPIYLLEKTIWWRQWAHIFCVNVYTELTAIPLTPSTCIQLSLTPPPPFGRHKWMALTPLLCRTITDPGQRALGRRSIQSQTSSSTRIRWRLQEAVSRESQPLAAEVKLEASCYQMIWFVATRRLSCL